MTWAGESHLDRRQPTRSSAPWLSCETVHLCCCSDLKKIRNTEFEVKFADFLTGTMNSQNGTTLYRPKNGVCGLQPQRGILMCIKQRGTGRLGHQEGREMVRKGQKPPKAWVPCWRHLGRNTAPADRWRVSGVTLGFQHIVCLGI